MNISGLLYMRTDIAAYDIKKLNTRRKKDALIDT